MQDYSITSQSKGKHLTNQDRLNIERWHNKEGLSNREIARLLNKAHGTIDREMKRGEIQLKRKVKYSAKKAQENYEGLRAHSVRPSKLTTEIDCYVSTRLKEDKDSLEVIHQALKGVSLSSLYNWVNWGWLEAKRHHLFYPQYKAAKKIKPRAPKHPFGKSIEERPEFINNRLEVGHYEIDTVILTRAKNKVLLTLTERKYRTEITFYVLLSVITRKVVITLLKQRLTILAVSSGHEEHTIVICPFQKFFLYQLNNLRHDITTVNPAVPHYAELIGLINNVVHSVRERWMVNTVKNCINDQAFSQFCFSFSFTHGYECYEVDFFLCKRIVRLILHLRC